MKRAARSVSIGVDIDAIVNGSKDLSNLKKTKLKKSGEGVWVL